MVTKKKNLKICLIGNSHSGCFKTGWDEISGYFPHVEIKFYPHCGNFYDMFIPLHQSGELDVENDFVKNTFANLSGNEGKIALSDFDICIIVGGYGAWGGMLDLGYSRQVYEKTAIDAYRNAHVSVLIDKIREISDIPILAIHNPFAAHRENAPPAPNWFNTEKGFSVVNEMAAGPRNVTLLRQPDETLAQANSSRLEYAAGERLTGASLVPGADQEIIDDLVHMNAAYGALFLSRILKKQGFSPRSLKLPVPDGHLPFAQRKVSN